MSTDEFAEWLFNELDRRGWSYSELARRGNFAHSSISQIVNEGRQPGLKVALGIARAFGVPHYEVLRQAGLLPPLPGGEHQQVTQEMVEVAEMLPVEVLQDFLGLLKLKAQQVREKESRGNAPALNVAQR